MVSTLYRPDYMGIEVTQLSNQKVPGNIVYEDIHKNHGYHCFPEEKLSFGFNIRPIYLSMSDNNSGNCLDDYAEFNLCHAVDIKRPLFIDSKKKDVICYSIYYPSSPGNLDAKKAAALGVPRGPEMGKLTRGESVTTPDGKLITPEECMSAETPGGILLVIDCPNEEYLPILQNNLCLKHILLNENVSHIVHLSPLEIIQHQDYINFTTPSKNIIHFFSHSDTSNVPLIYLASSELQKTVRSVLEENTMPNLYETSQKNIQALTLNKKTLTNNLIKKYGKQVVYGEFLSKIVFHPKKKLKIDQSECDAFIVSIQSFIFIIIVLCYFLETIYKVRN